MLIDDIEYVIFRHPDPGAARQFMLDFGLLELEQKGDRLYMRSYGYVPFSYVTSKGDAAFVGMGESVYLGDLRLIRTEDTAEAAV